MKRAASLVGASAMILSLSLGAAWAQQSTATPSSASPPAATDPKVAGSVAGEKPKAPASPVTSTPETMGKPAGQPAATMPKGAGGTLPGKSMEQAAEPVKALEKATVVKEATPAKGEAAPASKEGVKAESKPAAKTSDPVASDKTTAQGTKESEKAAAGKTAEPKVEKPSMKPALDPTPSAPVKAGETAAPKQ